MSRTLLLFSVFDSAAKAYMRPFLLETRGMALRGFMDAVSDPKTEISKHPTDYTLFEIGTFDEDTAMLYPLKTPVKVAAAHELIRKGDDNV